MHVTTNNISMNAQRFADARIHFNQAKWLTTQPDEEEANK